LSVAHHVISYIVTQGCASIAICAKKILSTNILSNTTFALDAAGLGLKVSMITQLVTQELVTSVVEPVNITSKRNGPGWKNKGDQNEYI
jgi:hypothetical protein